MGLKKNSKETEENNIYIPPRHAPNASENTSGSNGKFDPSLRRTNTGIYSNNKCITYIIYLYV